MGKGEEVDTTVHIINETPMEKTGAIRRSSEVIVIDDTPIVDDGEGVEDSSTPFKRRSRKRKKNVVSSDDDEEDEDERKEGVGLVKMKDLSSHSKEKPSAEAIAATSRKPDVEVIALSDEDDRGDGGGSLKGKIKKKRKVIVDSSDEGSVDVVDVEDEEDEEAAVEREIQREMDLIFTKTKSIGTQILHLINGSTTKGESSSSHHSSSLIKHSDVLAIYPKGLRLKDYQLVGVNWLWILHQNNINGNSNVTVHPLQVYLRC